MKEKVNITFAYLYDREVFLSTNQKWHSISNSKVYPSLHFNWSSMILWPWFIFIFQWNDFALDQLIGAFIISNLYLGELWYDHSIQASLCRRSVCYDVAVLWIFLHFTQLKLYFLMIEYHSDDVSDSAVHSNNYSLMFSKFQRNIVKRNCHELLIFYLEGEI